MVLGTWPTILKFEGVGQKRVAMGMCARVLRAAGVAILLLGGIAFDVAVLTVPSGYAYAQSASSIVVEGNRRVEADTVRSYFKAGGGSKSDFNAYWANWLIHKEELLRDLKEQRFISAGGSLMYVVAGRVDKS